MTRIIEICTSCVSGIPKRYLSPLFICSVPRPKDVATPATVAKTAKVSISFQKPFTLFSPINGSNILLIRPGLFFLN